MHLETLDVVALGGVNGGFIRASSSTNALMLQQMSMISSTIQQAALQQNQMSPMMVAMLGLLMMNR